MLRSELLPHIYDLTPTEKERLEKSADVPSRFYEYLDTLGRKNANGVYHLPGSHFTLPVRKSNPTIWGKLESSPHQLIMTLKKASRFYKEPMAYADFIAIRYVYSGQTTIYAQNGQFTLRQNDLCFLTHGFTLSQHLEHKEDLVFTLMFEKDNLLSGILEDVPGGGMLAKFMLNYIIGNKNPQNYIIFHGGENDRIRHIFEDMLCEYLDPSVWGKELILTYAKLLLFEMLGCRYEYEETSQSRHSYQLARILTKIDTDYRTVTLEDLARELGYNSSYLSRMVKEGTGKNFKELVLEKRMEQAAFLLKNTSLSIHEIMLQTGLSNETYFYKKFRAVYGCSPKLYKETWFLE